MTWLTTAVVASSFGAVIGIVLAHRLCCRHPQLLTLLFDTPAQNAPCSVDASAPPSPFKQHQASRRATSETGASQDAHDKHDMGLGLTVLLSKVFPYAATAIEAMVHEIVPSMLERYKPKWMEGIQITKFSLGSEPPVIIKMRVDSHKSSPEEDEIRIVMGMRWVSNTDIQLHVKPLPANLKFMPGFMEKGLRSALSLHAGVSRIVFDSTVLVTLAPLRKRLPVAAGMQVCLLDPPSIDFTMSITKDSDESRLLNLLKPWLIDTIKASCGFLTLPEHLHIPLELGAPDVSRPHGVLQVSVVSAGKVPSMDLLSKSDTYCKFWVRPRVVHRTMVCSNCYYPEWNHKSHLLVHDKKYQYLMMELWDDDTDDMIGAGGDDFIGSVYVRLSDVPEDGSEVKLHLPVSSQRIDTTRDPCTLPLVKGDKDEGGVCRLNLCLRWIPAGGIAAFPQLQRPGCVNVYVKKLSIKEDWAERVFPLGLATSLLGSTYESPLKWKAPKKPVTSDEPAVNAQVVGTPAGSASSSPVKLEMTGAGAEAAEEAGRVQLVLPYIASFDVLGVTEEGLRAAKVEVQVKGGPRHDTVSRLEVPLRDVLAKPVAGVRGVFGGCYTVTDRLGIMTASMEVWWHGLMR